MPTLRERFTDILLGDEKRRLQESTQLLYDFYIQGPFVQTPEELVRQLSEYDSAILTDLIHQIEYEQLGAGYQGDTGAERKRAVDESIRLWRYSPLASWNIWLWTNYGLGETVVISPEDERAAIVWREFWTADRNQTVLAADKIHTLSNWLLITGNQFLAFYAAEADGETTVRKIPASEIVEIITHPDDASKPLFYKRQWTPSAGEPQRTWYYPDWSAFFSGELDETNGEEETLAQRVLPKNAIRADRIGADGQPGQLNSGMSFGTTVCILHIGHNQKEETSLWGWPLGTAANPWDKAHKKFREDRAAVSSLIAMWVNKIKHTGGSRAGDSMRAKLKSRLTASNTTETNPPSVPGTWIENQGAELSRMSQATGAGDAKMDGEALAWMAGLGYGVFPHYDGLGDAYRLATATAMEKPLEMQWSRYQLFWSAQFRKMVRIVLQMKEKYSSVKFATYEAEVSTDRLVQVDLVAISDSVSQMYRDIIMPQVELGTMSPEAVQAITACVIRIMLQALGVTDVDEIASDKVLGVGGEEKVSAAVQLVKQKLADGKLEPEQAAEYALGLLVERV